MPRQVVLLVRQLIKLMMIRGINIPILSLALLGVVIIWPFVVQPLDDMYSAYTGVPEVCSDMLYDELPSCAESDKADAFWFDVLPNIHFLSYILMILAMIWGNRNHLAKEPINGITFLPRITFTLVLISALSILSFLIIGTPISPLADAIVPWFFGVSWLSATALLIASFIRNVSTRSGAELKLNFASVIIWIPLFVVISYYALIIFAFSYMH